MKFQILSLSLVLFFSCTTLRKLPDSNIQSDYYEYKPSGAPHSKVYIEVLNDSLKIIPVDHGDRQAALIQPKHGQVFLKRSFDIDVMTVPFKFRPATQNLPRQLTVDFNGSVFFGYRIDQHKLLFSQTPSNVVKKVRHRAITMGVFGGIGTTSITPWTTNYGTTDEYNGFIFNRGISLMAGVNNLTVGFGIGWDFLTDRDNDTWIYQNKAWYGLTLSLNLN